MIRGRRIRAARALLGWSQQELADKALVSTNAFVRLERKHNQACRTDVESAGGQGEGVRLAKATE